MTDIAKEIERITGEFGFLHACQHGEVLCPWNLCENPLAPMTHHRITEAGMDLKKELAKLKQGVKGLRDPLDPVKKPEDETSVERERSATAKHGHKSKRSKSRCQSRIRSASIPKDDSTNWTARQKRKYVNESKGGLHLGDPDVPYLTLTRLLQRSGQMGDMEKLLCYSLFRGSGS